MAPSCDIGHPQRSLVRIPGSGTDKSKKPVCLEIAQITNFQMAHVIPLYQLPPPDAIGIRHYPPFSIFEPRRNTHATVNANVISIRLPLPVSVLLEETSTTSTCNSESRPLKRPREENESETPNKRSSSPQSEDDEPAKDADPNIRKIQILLEDRSELKKENEKLMFKLNKFKELLKDRSKVNEFLSVMKELKIMPIS